MKSWIEIADMYADAAEAYRQAKGVSCVRDPARWQAALPERIKRKLGGDFE